MPKNLQTKSPTNILAKYCEGLCDLERLLRYEQRAWSRRKKAIRAFMAINLANLDQEEPT
ncbi:MAG: hypothetical protein WB037_16660 [Pseudolabrys sp.]